MTFMNYNEDFCFEIFNSSIDVQKCIDYLNNEDWESYTQFDESYQGYHGIGLTSASNSITPDLDSLMIHQKIARHRTDDKEIFNWQIMTDPTRHVHGYVKEIFSKFTLIPHRARFAKIDPDSNIALHTDDYTENVTRVHWPIITDDNNYMLGLNQDTRKIDRYNFKSGKCYAINTNILHGVINRSNIARIHLIVNFNVSFQEFKHYAKDGLFKL